MTKQLVLAAALFAFGLMGTASAASVTVVDNGDRTATVTGTAGDDNIAIEEWCPGFAFIIDVAAGYEVCDVLDLADFDSVFVNGLGGNDTLENRNVDIFFFANGGAGDDILLGSDLALGVDDLVGGDGNDFIYGGLGFEFILGEGGNDYIFADSWAGGDTEPSTIVGGDGSDTIIGTTNADIIIADDGEFDFIDCQGGGDMLTSDEIDHLVNCD